MKTGLKVTAERVKDGKVNILYTATEEQVAVRRENLKQQIEMIKHQQEVLSQQLEMLDIEFNAIDALY